MLALSVGSEATVGEVAQHLHRVDPTRMGSKVPAGVTLVVTPYSMGPDASSRGLDFDMDFGSSGVRSGDHVAISTGGRNERANAGSQPAVAKATIISGPDKGKSFDLPAGSSVIGRDADVAVRLSDSLASKRHARITIGDEIEVVDMGSTNGIIIGDAFVTRAKLLPGDTLVIGDTEIEIVRGAVQHVVVPTTSTVPFTRSPRVVPGLPEVELELPSPPAKSKPRRFPLIALAGPILLGLTMFAVTGRALTLVFVAMSPLMMIGTFFDSRSVAKRELREQSEDFDETLASTRLEIASHQAIEKAVRLQRAPAVADVVEAVKQYGRLLWTHRPEHRAFLSVRLGLGAVPSSSTLKLPGRGESYPGFWERLLETAAEFSEVKDVPILADLRSAGNLGISGDVEIARGVARASLAQIAGLHSPLECVMTAFTSPASREAWRWMAWLPHTSSPVSPIAGDHLADSRGGSAHLLASIEAVVAARAKQDIGSLVPAPRGLALEEMEDAPPPMLPTIVVLVEDDALADRNRLIRLAEKGPDVNVHVIWIAASAARVPAASRTFLEVADASSAGAGVVRLGQTHTPIACEVLSVEAATDFARRLACVEDVGIVVDDAADIPRAVSFVELHGNDSVEPGTYERQWKVDSAAGKKRPFTLRALVGHAGGEPCYLDLRAQGPHALVGGTTGAGKSEFLQAWILGMAAAYGPDKVTFLFVDYKGGSAFADCVTLPHCVGLVTDLTPHLVDRALASLRAELHHRERLLQTKKAKDLESLERAGDPDAPPSLVIVIDEFAALVQEVPTFVDGVVDIAQRGRSLGLHLIMATQRPAGVIKDNLRANTNLRIALRMADEADSTDILGIASAAHIDPSMPGRAIARTGPGRIATFQSAYAGGRTSADSGPPPVEVLEMAMGAIGPWTLPATTGGETADEGPTDAERVVSAMKSATKLAELAAPRRPWLDELQPTYELRHLAKHRGERIPLGIVDDPAHQAQETLYYVPDVDGNLAFYGGPGVGKSTALRTLALAATLSRDIAPVHVFGIDAGGGGLDILNVLPNVGDIVAADDQERVGRLLRKLVETVDERAGRYSAARASDLTEYRKISKERGEQRVFLLIDGYPAFQADYMNESGRARMFDDFMSVLNEGRGVGVHVVVAADRLGALHSSVQAQFSRSIVMRMVDDNQYGFMGIPKGMLASDSPAGRGVDVASSREVQIAVLGNTRSVVEQAQHVEALSASIPDLDEWKAPSVPRMPAMVPGASMPHSVGDKPVLGVESETLEPMGFSLGRPFMLTGQAGTGRTSTLKWMNVAIARAFPKSKQVFVSLRQSDVAAGSHWHATAQGAAEVEALLQKLGSTFDKPAGKEGGIVLVVEGVNDFSGSIADGPLVQAIKQLKRGGHTVVGEAELSGWSGGMVSSEIKGARRGLFLQPEQSDGPLTFGVSFPRINRAEMPPGRGVYVEGGRVSVVQIPVRDGE